MEIIQNFYDFLVGDIKLYWICAIFGSLIFLIQLLFALLGLGDHADIDADTGIEVHADTGLTDFKFFSLRSVTAFITFFGWGGVIFGKNGLPGFLAALASGLLMMTATAVLIYFLLKMEESGNINPNDYISVTGKVYLGIPPGRTKSGIVSVSVKGSLREIEAVSDEELPTGTPVKIVESIDGQRFLVKKYNINKHRSNYL